jgi:diguanylate cyclase (GGDEF)-like protein
MLGGWLITKFAKGLKAFNHPRTLVSYVLLAAVLSTTVSATIGVSVLTFAGSSHPSQYLQVWLTWWLGDMISNLVIAPWLVLLLTHRWTKPTVKLILGSIVTFALLFMMEGFIFFNWPRSHSELHSLTYLILPLLLLIVFRFGALGVSSAVIVTSGIAIGGTLGGYGPFANGEPNESLLLVQTFLGTIAISMLVVAAVLKQRKRAERALVKSNKQLQEKEQRMRFQAFHDLLTDLPNRSALEERLTLALEIAKRHKRQIAVLFIDFDNFKIINDSFGHLVGDEILKLAGKRLKNNVRAEDTVARMGGDEFVILLSEINTKQDAAKVADVLLKVFQTPFILQNQTLPLTISVGIAIFPTDGETVSGLLHHADVALYRAKQNGRNQYYFFDESIT